jgi:hypothetical protein
MADLVNLRAVRKRAKRRQEEERARSNRLVHGQPKRLRKLADAERVKAERTLEGHRIETGDDR